MTGTWTDKFSFISGAVRRRDVAYVALANDKLLETQDDHFQSSVWHQGNWFGDDHKGMYDWTTVGVAVCQVPLEQGLYLGLWGEVLCVGSGDVHEEVIQPSESDCPKNRGAMRGIRGIDGKAYAVGVYRQAYRRNDKDDWVCIDHSARPDPEDEAVVSFEAIDGFSSGSIFAVGRRGEIWTYKDDVWNQLDSPTNMILTNVCCAGDGNVYACGRLGTILVGGEQSWSMVEQDLTEEDFWGICWFKDRLYLSTARQLYFLDGDRIVPIDFGGDVPGTCFHLSAADGVLWSIGAKDIMAFDGNTWTRIE